MGLGSSTPGLSKSAQWVSLTSAATLSLKRSMRQTHLAGEKRFVDYAGQTVPLVDAATGEITKAQIFVATFGASNYTYACATARQTTKDWIENDPQGEAMAWSERHQQLYRQDWVVYAKTPTPPQRFWHARLAKINAAFTPFIYRRPVFHRRFYVREPTLHPSFYVEESSWIFSFSWPACCCGA